MKHRYATKDELVIAIVTDKTEKGVLLLLQHANDSFTKQPILMSKEKALTTKHQLFFSHYESFFGVDLQIRSYPLNNDHSQSLRGIFIPVEKMDYLMQMDLDRFNGAFHPSSKAFMQTIEELLDHLTEKEVTPTAQGYWTFSSQLSSEIRELAIPVLSQKTDDPVVFIEKNKEKVLKWFEDWLQHYVPKSETFSKLIQIYKKSLSMNTDDPHIDQWIQALSNPNQSFLISNHLYPICTHLWNGKTPEPFQLQLVIYEPESHKGAWRLEWYLKEWLTQTFVSITNIVAGDHPFRSNPIPWLKRESSIFEKEGLPFSYFDEESYRFYMDHDTFADYLLHGVKRLEEKGVSVLIPESLKKKIVPRLKARLSLYDPEENIQIVRPWVKSHVSWQLKVQDLEIEESLFRKMVQQQQRVIHIHDAWVVWDLDMASKLLSHVDQSAESGAPFTFFDGLRAALHETDSYPSGENTADEQGSLPIDWSLSTAATDLLEAEKGQTKGLISLKWIDLLRDYQQQGTEWLLKMRKVHLGCCLADDMGLGKTIQTIAYIDEVHSHEQSSTPFLILCPSSLVHNWTKELKKFAENLSVYHHSGSPIEREQHFNEQKSTADVIVCSYPVATRDLDLFRSIHWCGCIYDEAQLLKNSRTKQRKAMKELKAKHHVALSGTPIENHPIEMWSMMDLLNPGLLKDDVWFTENFLSTTNSKDKEDKLSHLRSIVRPFLLRRTKEAFMEELALPEKTSVDHIVSLSTEQQVLYEAVVEEFNDSYDEDHPVPLQRALLFKTMTKLKQICNHPGQLFKETGDFLFEQGRSEKWDLARKIMESWLTTNKRGLIFTQYRFVGSLIQAYGQRHWNISIPFFHGGLSSKKREEMIEQFQSHQTAPIMVISLRAGGFGINMTEATEVIHYDRWWNPAVEAQATDRIHRIGQTKPVQVHTITTAGTIEDRIAHLLQQKKKLQKAVIDGRPLPIWTLSKAELNELFKKP
ncbi:hypothetical protein CR194_10325 [Salipaludibacillus keqinensis]|uniref:ATP-dependent helicase n=1 Tax=Salipaludibacillus keqinensis TaxID=2045207 RepID=A0A323TLU1_9BACI|nr:DEAD/DEAH box helicase [Salipaludibacillus keqinensis]PYZ93553.1 hypothetical protein CR194_10325 [Salipaludibacillus keqinensis]